MTVKHFVNLIHYILPHLLGQLGCCMALNFMKNIDGSTNVVTETIEPPIKDARKLKFGTICPRKIMPNNMPMRTVNL